MPRQLKAESTKSFHVHGLDAETIKTIKVLAAERGVTVARVIADAVKGAK
jgi:hypothetical protein